MAALYADESVAKEAGARRAEQLRAQPPNGAPSGAARLQPFKGEFRAQLIDRDGEERYQLDGYATIFGRAYEMWDFFGPYSEIVEQGAADETLAADPDVAFLVNHRGVTMARTTNKTLELEADALGLRSRAFVNPKRQDVRDLMVAVDDKDITEMSFAFMITEGGWNDDFTEFRIKKFDINRGDVSAVNYGANPYTSIAARAQEILAELDQLPIGAARAALQRLQHRIDRSVVPVPVKPADQTGGRGQAANGQAAGMSVELVRARLAVLADE